MDPKLYGPQTITVEYVQTILERDICDRDIAVEPPPEFHCRKVLYHHSGNRMKIRGVNENKDILAGICLKLFTAARDPANHISKIDGILSEYIECCFLIPSTRAEEGHILRSKAEKTCQLLKRLPATTPVLPTPGYMHNLSPEYYTTIPDTTTSSVLDDLSDDESLWKVLKVAKWLSTNTIRIALWIVIGGLRIHGNWSELLGDLLDRASRLTLDFHSHEDKSYWFIVRAALWNCWQNAILLRHYAEMQQCVRFGFADTNNETLYNRSGNPLPDYSIHEYSRAFSFHNKAVSMCSWAFELLRNNPVCINADFREFHQCYLIRWNSASGRCSKDKKDCSGQGPEGCLRFKGMKIDDQTTHHSSCDKTCRRVKWNSDSYRRVSGSRAVQVEQNPSECEHLNYCAASENTLVISHVWSHGQGGRPHEGVNLCLHQRYSALAKNLGCDSYWWDSTCIPEDHDLRQEAIKLINQTFYDAKVTLACDRDIMNIDITGPEIDDLHIVGRVLREPPISTCEIILSTLVVCDWNVRAWTYLESVRGRRDLHLLCKNDHVVSMRHVLQTVFQQGRLSILALGLTIGHVFPMRPLLDEKAYDRTRTYGNFNLEQAGSVLCHRHATRPGDDMVIWSLLVERPVGERTLWAKLKYPDEVPAYKGRLYELLKSLDRAERALYRRHILKERMNGNAEEFWRSQIGGYVHTGFLISSARRLRSQGLSWAPASPACDAIFEKSASGKQGRFPSFEDRDTNSALITHYGLIGNWLIHEFYPMKFVQKTADFLGIQELSPGGELTPEQYAELARISRRFLRGCLWGALIRPMALYGGRVERWSEYRGESAGKLIAVLGARRWHGPAGLQEIRKKERPESHMNGPLWRWKGVYEWPENIVLPEFDDPGLTWANQILIA